MSDPSKLTTKQEIKIVSEAKERTKASSTTPKAKAKGNKKGEDFVPYGTLYKQGKTLINGKGFELELKSSGDHCNHAIMMPLAPPEIEGVEIPKFFKPTQEIFLESELTTIASVFNSEACPQEVRDFWAPLYNPKPGDSELNTYTQRLIQMNRIKERREFTNPVKMGHTFDPMGRINGNKSLNPRIWVPDKDWFHPSIRDVRFEDVFTIFPEAERKLLMLLLGRVGVGRSNHVPDGWTTPILHTARMAVVIVGKDPGLGKSTIFNGMISAFAKCGFTTQTFKSTEDRFGMKATALSDIAYKDDTSLPMLKKFLSSEDTKIMITNGMFQVEDKYMAPEQIMPKSVFIVNSNDWENKFAYDLDPGIIDRIKIVSTYKKRELDSLLKTMDGVSEGSPDLRPSVHLPYLAEKLGVSIDALYLWCLRLSTDWFWEIINDRANPSVNKLEQTVRHWTTRLRIRFKSDVIQAIINSMAFSWALRTGNSRIPELSPFLLKECLEHFYFIGVDPSAQTLVQKMKERWEKAGRPTTHYYQGFREVRWESVRKAMELAREWTKPEESRSSEVTFSKKVKQIIETLDLRDGFQVGGAASYVIENWEDMRYGKLELIEEGNSLLEGIDDGYTSRIKNLNVGCYDKWLENKSYSPDDAEHLRTQAISAVYKSVG